MSDYIPTSDITDDDKLWAMLSMIIPLIAIVMMLMEDKKARPFIKYYAVHGLAFGVVAWVISAILTPVAFIGCVVGLAVLGYSIYLGVKAYQGEFVEIPFVTDFCKNQGWID